MLADPFMHMSSYTNNFLKTLHNLLYQNPCLICLSVSYLCKTLERNTYSAYSDELRDVYTIILLDIYRKLIMLKLKESLLS